MPAQPVPEAWILDALPDTFIEFNGRGVAIRYLGGGSEQGRLHTIRLAGARVHDCWPSQSAERFVGLIRKSLVTRQDQTFDLLLGDEASDAFEVRVFVQGPDRVLAVFRRLDGVPTNPDSHSSVDTLTGLATRERFLLELEHMLEDAKLRERGLAVMCVDIDRFSRVNETLGRDVGDNVLRVIGKRLQGCFRDADQIVQLSTATTESTTLARIDGDEFVMVLTGVASRDDVRIVSRRVKHSFEEPVSCDDHSISIEPSIGISLFPDDGNDAKTLFENARVALNQARDFAANTGVFYSGTLQTRALNRLDLMQELRWAIDRGQFELHYLPRLDLRTGYVTGLEALLRWQHPIRGTVPTNEIIPLAETVGLMDTITQWIIESACRFARELNEKSAQAPVISINLSEREFAREDLANLVSKSLSASGLVGDRLELEFTESALMRNRKGAATLRKLKALGVRIVIDDLGTGHVSLAELASLPVDSVKIDRGFIEKVEHEISVQKLCAAIIAMGRELGLTVIAEGIESDAQYDFLRRHDCDAGQGFLFARPLPADRIVEYLERAANHRGAV